MNKIKFKKLIIKAKQNEKTTTTGRQKKQVADLETLRWITHHTKS